MKKKILSLIMAVCLVTTCMLSMGISASAATPTLIVMERECKVGDMVELEVYANEPQSYACMVFSPSFDHSIFEIVGVNCNIESGTFLYNEDTENPKFIWYNTENYTTSISEILFTISLRVREDAPIGKHAVTVDYEAKNICDENGELVEVEVRQGSVTTFLSIRGDSDGDLLITGSDVVMLARYLVDLETEINQGADVNGDGSIDGRDLVKLSRYLIDLEEIDNPYNQP